MQKAYKLPGSSFFLLLLFSPLSLMSCYPSSAIQPVYNITPKAVKNDLWAYFGMLRPRLGLIVLQLHL